MSIEDANISIKPVLTKEQVDYEEALKNMKYTTAKLRISQEGINTSDISPKILDDVTELFDEMDTIQRDFNVEAQKIQQDTNNKMRILQEGANKKFVDAQNMYRELINPMKTGTTIDKKEDGTEETNIFLTKEREEEIKKEFAALLAESQSEKT